ncbi:MAG: RDD family protein, partial [Pseudomonadota bacterium]
VTLVWRFGLAEWQPFSALQAGDVNGSLFCSQCGRRFPRDDMIHFSSLWVCADCKPYFIQRLKEGLVLPGVVVYAGFWLRFGAKFIDWIIIWVVNVVLYIPLAIIAATGSGLAMALGMVSYYVVQIVAGAAYDTYFVGRYGATLGKMACQIKAVTSDGGRVSYLRALGRHFAELLSGLTLGIGYLLAAFDEEKKTLHDRICDTRVIKK